MMEWAVYALVFTGLLLLDFLVTRGEEVTVKKSISMTVFYIGAALCFSVFVFQRYGLDVTMEYLTVFALEKMLSMDNLLVIFMIFSYFGISKAEQHKALLLGILGAIVFRMSLILSGVYIVERMTWILYIFAAFLIYSGYKIMTGEEDGYDPEQSKIVSFLKNKFGKSGAFIGAVIAVEVSDIMFAVDSIPAAFSVTQNSFAILTANLFAVLGLRSLYHAIAHGIEMFNGIEKYIGAVLVLVGMSVFSNHFLIHIPETVLMGAVFFVLGMGIAMCRKGCKS